MTLKSIKIALTQIHYENITLASLVTIVLSKQQIDYYQQWEKTMVNDLPGRYEFGFSGIAVFSISKDDILKRVGHFDVENIDNYVQISYGDANDRSSIELRNVDREAIVKLINAIDGVSRFGDICCSLEPHFNANEVQAVCLTLLGRIIENEEPVNNLQGRIRREEIVRFPAQSPYMLLRPYWSNCADVRNRVPGLFDETQDTKQLMDKVADLHIVATMGKKLDSYYGGSGGVATIPGGYRTHPVRTGMSEVKAIFIDTYLQENNLGKIPRNERYVSTESGTLLGIVADNAMTFRHPPPDNGLLEKIFDEIRMLLVEITITLETGDQSKLIEYLSRFHKLFLHAHPFYNINNSVAMNIVNYCLFKANIGVIPHLLLDFIALRLEFNDYQHIFCKSVEDYALQGGTEDDETGAMIRISHYYEKLKNAERLASGFAEMQ